MSPSCWVNASTWRPQPQPQPDAYTTNKISQPVKWIGITCKSGQSRLVFLHSKRSQGAGKSDTVFSAQSPQVKCMIAGGSSSTTTPLYQTRAKRCHGPTEGCEGWIHCYWKDHLASALVRYQLGLMEKLCRVRQTNKWGRLAELKEASCSRPTRSWMSSPSYHIGHRQNNRADPWQE